MTVRTARTTKTTKRATRKAAATAISPLGAMMFWRLPFLALSDDHRPGAAAWDLPQRGGYHGGYETGKHAATLFLKALREDGDTPEMALLSIFESFSVLFESAGGYAESRKPTSEQSEAMISWRGQLAGFCGTLQQYLGAAAKASRKLDELSESALTRAMFDGLERADEAFDGRMTRVAAEVEQGIEEGWLR